MNNFSLTLFFEFLDEILLGFRTLFGNRSFLPLWQIIVVCMSIRMFKKIINYYYVRKHTESVY